MCSGGSDKEKTGQAFTAIGCDFSGSFQFGSRSPKVLMKPDTDVDDNEISVYQLLMKSLTCQLQTGDSVLIVCLDCAPLNRGSVMFIQKARKSDIACLHPKKF